MVIPARGARGEFTAFIPPEHELLDVLTPEYFGNMNAGSMKPGTKITVTCKRFRWEFDLVVTGQARPGYVPTALIGPIKQIIPCGRYRQAIIDASNKVDVDPGAAPQRDLPDGYKVEYAGAHGWRVVVDGEVATYKGDKAVRLGTREDAIRVAHEIAA